MEVPITPINEFLFYFRLIIFPLCSLGFVVSAVYEYQYGHSKLRLGIMIAVAVLMLIWMALSIAAVYSPEAMEGIRALVVTPLVFILTVLIWTYAISRTRKT